MGKREKVADEIIKLLKKDSRGLTIQEISEKTKVSRITASMVLMKLEGAGKLDIRILGNCKLHYLRNAHNIRISDGPKVKDKNKRLSDLKSGVKNG